MENKNITINDLSVIVKNGFDELGNVIKVGFEQVDKRFEQIDKRFEDVYSRLDSIDAKLIFIQKEIEDIKEGLDGLEKRTIEDSNVFGGDIIELKKRIGLLEKKVDGLSHS